MLELVTPHARFHRSFLEAADEFLAVGEGPYAGIVVWPADDSFACFESDIYAIGPRWYDDKGHELQGPVPPVGVWGGGNYRTLEDEVCKALGIPLAPDD
jgi:hypothetical protein